jgi:NitT/TauT family transport system substrate-binding protein
MIGWQMRRAVLAGPVVAIVALLAACGSDSDSGSGQQATPAAPGATGVAGAATPTKRLSTSFIIPSNTSEIQFPLYFVAKELGFYDEENLDVKFVNSEGSGAAVQQMVAGQVDMGTPHASAVLNAANSGQAMRYIYTYSTTGTFGLFVKEDSPIRDPRDLVGKTIGVTDENGGEVAILSAVFKGLGKDITKDAKLVAIGEGGPATFQAISGNQVAAFAMSYADTIVLSDTAGGGLKIREITPQEFQSFPAHGISITKKNLDDADKRQAATRLGRGLAKATLFCQTNWEACVQIIKKMKPEAFQKEALQRAVMDRARTITTVPEGRKFGEHRPEAWRSFIEFQRASDEKFKLTPDFVNEFLVNDLLAEINNFDKDRITKMAREYKTS